MSTEKLGGTGTTNGTEDSDAFENVTRHPTFTEYDERILAMEDTDLAHFSVEELKRRCDNVTEQILLCVAECDRAKAACADAQRAHEEEIQHQNEEHVAYTTMPDEGEHEKTNVVPFPLSGHGIIPIESAETPAAPPVSAYDPNKTFTAYQLLVQKMRVLDVELVRLESLRRSYQFELARRAKQENGM